VLDKLEGIQDSFSFGLSDGGSNQPDSGHGGRFVVSEVLVGHLDLVRVVVDGLFCFLGEVSEVGAGGLGRVLGFVALQELSLDGSPVVHVISIFN